MQPRQWLKGLLRLRNCTPNYALYRELDRKPFVVLWWAQITRFLQTLLFQHSISNHFQDALLGTVLEQNYLDAVGGIRNWSFDVLSMLQFSNPTSFQPPATVQGLLPLLPSLERYIQGLFQIPRFTVEHNPRTCQYQRLLTTYIRWFEFEQDNGLPPYFSYGISVDKIRCFAKFRLGSHDLQVQTAAWQHVPRHMRVCQFCHANEVDDEYHAIFDCSALQHIRQVYPHLFSGRHVIPGSVHSFMCRPDQLDLVNFIWNITNFRLRGLPGP